MSFLRNPVSVGWLECSQQSDVRNCAIPYGTESQLYSLAVHYQFHSFAHPLLDLHQHTYSG